MKPDIILTTGPLGGLGDHLDFSTLPRRFAELGHKVFLSDECIARTDEAMDIIWKCNPYITGFNDERRPNAGYALQGRFYDVANRLPIGCIEAMERTHDLPPPYSIAPEIHYQPKPYHQDLSKITLYDPAALSSAVDGHGWARFQQKMQDRFGGNIYLVTHDPSVASVPPFAEGTATLGVNSLYEYVDMLATCRAWIGSESGAQALAAAVRGNHDVYDMEARPEIVCLIAPNTFNSRSYTFRGVDYRVSKFAAGDDYLEPVEVPYDRYNYSCRAGVTAKRDAWREAKAGLRG